MQSYEGDSISMVYYGYEYNGYISHGGNAQMMYDHYSMHEASSPPAVDCTLSLATPSTRMQSDQEINHNHRHHRDHKTKRSSSKFGWNIFSSSSSKHAAPSINTDDHQRYDARGGDPLLSRRCANCDTTSTPLWRNGPRGPKSLCNACGIRYKKEERRAAANSGGGATRRGALESSELYQHGNSWAGDQVQPQIDINYNNSSYRFIEEDDHRDSETGHSILSWRFLST